MPQRVVMHIDLDYFYAQCEENLNPSIRGKPVVVCVYSGRSNESGVVSTCNYEARNHGVRAGIPIARAKKLLDSKDAVFLPMNRPFYEKVSDTVMKILKEESDSYEKAGIDEAYLEVTERANASFEQAEKIAVELKQQIQEMAHLTCSIGIAPNKLLAKIASDYMKPNGLTVIKPERVTSFINKLPVSKIPGVGRKVGEKLDQMHARTIDELAALDQSILIQAFGNSLGGYLHRASRGEDDEPVQDREQPIQFSRIATLKRNTHEISEILPLIRELGKSVTEKLIHNAMKCKSIGIIAILDDLSIHSRTKTLESPTADAKVVEKASEDLIEQFLRAMPTARLRRVGVKLTGLSKQGGQTDMSKFL